MSTLVRTTLQDFRSRYPLRFGALIVTLLLILIAGGFYLFSPLITGTKQVVIRSPSVVVDERFVAEQRFVPDSPEEFRKFLRAVADGVAQGITPPFADLSGRVNALTERLNEVGRDVKAIDTRLKGVENRQPFDQEKIKEEIRQILREELKKNTPAAVQLNQLKSELEGKVVALQENFLQCSAA